MNYQLKSNNFNYQESDDNFYSMIGRISPFIEEEDIAFFNSKMLPIFSKLFKKENLSNKCLNYTKNTASNNISFIIDVSNVRNQLGFDAKLNLKHLSDLYVKPVDLVLTKMPLSEIKCLKWLDKVLADKSFQEFKICLDKDYKEKYYQATFSFNSANSYIIKAILTTDPDDQKLDVKVDFSNLDEMVADEVLSFKSCTTQQAETIIYYLSLLNILNENNAISNNRKAPLSNNGVTEKLPETVHDLNAQLKKLFKSDLEKIKNKMRETSQQNLYLKKTNFFNSLLV